MLVTVNGLAVNNFKILFLHVSYLLIHFIHDTLVGSVNLLKSSLTRTEGYQGLQSELIFLKGHVFAKFQILRGTTIASIFSVLHQLRLLFFFITGFILFSYLLLFGNMIVTFVFRKSKNISWGTQNHSII